MILYTPILLLLPVNFEMTLKSHQCPRQVPPHTSGMVRSYMSLFPPQGFYSLMQSQVKDASDYWSLNRTNPGSWGGRGAGEWLYSQHERQEDLIGQVVGRLLSRPTSDDIKQQNPGMTLGPAFFGFWSVPSWVFHPASQPAPQQLWEEEFDFD